MNRQEVLMKELLFERLTQYKIVSVIWKSRLKVVIGHLATKGYCSAGYFEFSHQYKFGVSTEGCEKNKHDSMSWCNTKLSIVTKKTVKLLERRIGVSIKGINTDEMWLTGDTARGSSGRQSCDNSSPRVTWTKLWVFYFFFSSSLFHFPC